MLHTEALTRANQQMLTQIETHVVFGRTSADDVRLKNGRMNEEVCVVCERENELRPKVRMKIT